MTWQEDEAERISVAGSKAFNATDEADWNKLAALLEEGKYSEAEQYAKWQEICRLKEKLATVWAKAMGWRLTDGTYDLHEVNRNVLWVAKRHLDHVQGFKAKGQRKLTAVLSHSYNPNPVPQPVSIDRLGNETGEVPCAAVIRLPRSWWYPATDFWARGRDHATAYLFVRLERKLVLIEDEAL